MNNIQQGYHIKTKIKPIYLNINWNTISASYQENISNFQLV